MHPCTEDHSMNSGYRLNGTLFFAALHEFVFVSQELNERWRSLQQLAEERSQLLGSAHEVQRFHRSEAVLFLHTGCDIRGWPFEACASAGSFCSQLPAKVVPFVTGPHKGPFIFLNSKNERRVKTTWINGCLIALWEKGVFSIGLFIYLFKMCVCWLSTPISVPEVAHTKNIKSNI